MKGSFDPRRGRYPQIEYHCFKGSARQLSQPHVSLHRYSEDMLANIILTLATAKVYAEYLNKKKKQV